MKKSLQLLLAVFFILNFVSCNNDDDSSSTDPATTEERIAQSAIDDEVIKEFLSSHSYNSEFFETPSTSDTLKTDQDIVFTKIADGEDDSNSLLNLLDNGNTDDELKNVLKSFTVVTLENEEEITREMYVLFVRQGSVNGKSITEVDRALSTHKQKIILSNTNDSGISTELFETSRDSVSIPTWINNSGRLIGEALVFSQFRTASPMVENDLCTIAGINDLNGTAVVNGDFGIGVAFVPSGLALFDAEIFVNDGIDDDGDGESDDIEEEDSEAFRNLVYTFSAYNSIDTDLDGDGIPSSQEGGLDGNFFTNDTDDDGLPNFIDSDDDGDGILTFFEIQIDDFDADLDSDCDGILNNDNQVKFIYTNTDLATNSPELKFDFPGNIVSDSEIPYHLDVDVEFDPDDFDDEGNEIE